MQTLTVQIDGMTCGHCVEEITETLKTLNGVHVHSVRVGSATVSFDPRKISTVGSTLIFMNQKWQPQRSVSRQRSPLH